MVRNNVALAADQNYQGPMTTVIKSLMYHNDNINIYVINTNLPQEWFSNINRYLTKLNSKIIDKKIDENLFKNLATPGAYLSYMAYGRLLIPKIVPADKVLYLDSDTIVQDNLNNLFNTNLQDHYLAAVRDCVIDGFNSGVMLINNQKLKHENSKIQAIFSAGQNQSNPQADQSALNIVFGDDYLPLNDEYNYMIGSERDLFYHPEEAGDFFERISQVSNPKIVHYTSADKPWKLTSGGSMRELWWQYNNLSWDDVVKRSPLPATERNPKGSCFTFTRTLNLEHIEDLVRNLPDYDFNIASWVNMAPELMRLIQYHNVHLFPIISGPHIDQLIKSTNIYLDINDDKEAQMVEKANNLNKPILTFNSAALNQGYDNYQVFGDNDLDGMIHRIKEICQ